MYSVYSPSITNLLRQNAADAYFACSRLGFSVGRMTDVAERLDPAHSVGLSIGPVYELRSKLSGIHGVQCEETVV